LRQHDAHRGRAGDGERGVNRHREHAQVKHTNLRVV
jgi:hypothetical protein